MDPAASYTVIVDDRDERIVRDNWNVNLVGNDGCSLYFNSARRATSSGSKFTFQFNGTAVEVHGSLEQGASESVLLCTVDGTGIKTQPQPQLGHSKMDSVLCGGSNLDPNKAHSLEVVLQANSHIDLDYLLYEAPYDKLKNGDMIYYHSARTDAFTYTTAWNETQQATRMTVTEQSKANFSYYGSDVTVYTVGHESRGRFRGELYVDSDTGDSFAAKAASTQTGVDGCPFYQLYKGAGSSVGNHSLLLTYRGSANLFDNTPLEINFITAPAQGISESKPPVSPPSPSQSQLPTPHKGLSRGVIAGIVIGVVIGIAITLMLVFLCRRRQRAHAQWRENPGVDPFFSQPGDQSRTGRMNKGMEMQRVAASGNSSREHMLVSQDPAPSGLAGQFHWAVKQVRGLTQRQGEASGSQGPIRLQPESERVLVHSDSGVRLGDDGPSRLVEVPPIYTET